MTTLPGRSNTALLVIDVQNGVVDGAHERDAVVARIGSLVDRARAADVPVIWVQHSDEELPEGSEAWAYVPELPRADGEPVVAKRYGDSFEDTGLEELLAALGVGHLVVAGAQTDQCIRSTLHGALTRGYDATLVGDAHTTSDLSAYGAPPPEQVIAHTNLYWKYQTAPGRVGAVAAADEVAFASEPTG
ncbi:MAG TPA: cysteine hydrolase family protein [Solirubrobacteraceae bacterium]|nr:cysteine hydrolase family protein [Solirubrobacteraceae bacterium]